MKYFFYFPQKIERDISCCQLHVIRARNMSVLCQENVTGLTIVPSVRGIPVWALYKSIEPPAPSGYYHDESNYEILKGLYTLLDREGMIHWGGVVGGGHASSAAANIPWCRNVFCFLGVPFGASFVAEIIQKLKISPGFLLGF